MDRLIPDCPLAPTPVPALDSLYTPPRAGRTTFTRADVTNSDQELIDQCLSGHTAAFDVLVRRYEDRLRCAIYRLVGCHEDTCDILQETFLNAFRSLGQFRRGAGFYTWLYRIAFNRAITARRRRRRTSNLRAVADDRLANLPDREDEHRPSAALERDELRGSVCQALSALPDGERALLVMRDVDRADYDTIARTLRVPVGTIRSRLHRVRKKFRELLETHPTLAQAGSVQG